MANLPALLIVDDDPLITDTLAYVLGPDFQVIVANTRHEGIAQLRALPTPPPLALVDLGLPPLPHRPDEGFALITELLAHAPAMRILVLSGQNDDANARHARTLGAFDFIAKPAQPELLRAVLLRALSVRPATAPGPASEAAELIGNSRAMQKLRAQVRQFADSPFPVLIEGESGSGKEIIAGTCLHHGTRRAGKPYLALNCAAISPSLMEPTLFGYARGAFTGATGAKAGYFEEAGDGTLFLDEIGELPLELQPKLLRVLENGEFQRVGETQSRVSRARIVAATNRDLRREVREGRFRADLYHRLSVFTISVPPLREMDEDRLLLLEHFRQQYASQAGTPAFTLSAEARALWLGYPFPGNVRELRNIVIRLTARYPGQSVTPAELEQELDTPNEPPATVGTPPTRFTEVLNLALAHLQQGTAFSLDHTLAQWEKAYIEAALQLSRGNVSQAARLLGVNRTTLYSRMEGKKP